MDHTEQPSQVRQQQLTVRLVRLVRVLHQELHVSDQMCQAELQHDSEITHVLVVRTEVVAERIPLNSFPSVATNTSLPREGEIL